MAKGKARKIAHTVLVRIFNEGAYSNIALNQALIDNDVSSQERGLITEIVYGVLQHKLLIDYYLEPFLPQKMPKKWMLPLIEAAVYQLLYLDKVPAYAVMNETIDIAKRKGGAFIGKMTTAILRNFERSERRSLDDLGERDRLSIETSHPVWMVHFLCKQYPIETVSKILNQNNLPPERVARLNTLKSGDISDFTADIQPGALTLPKGNIAHTEAYKAGLVAIQDRSSQRVAPLLNPQVGERILDMCAAPGGKTMHIAALMNNTGTIIANDIHEHKLALMEESAARLGVSNVSFLNMDALTLGERMEAYSFDRILLDAPCSGLGVIRRKPDLRYRITEADMNALVDLQSDLLEVAWKLLKVGGTLVYSTCTINKYENHLQVEHFIGSHDDGTLVEELDLAVDAMSDGFYIAKIIKG